MTNFILSLFFLFQATRGLRKAQDGRGIRLSGWTGDAAGVLADWSVGSVGVCDVVDWAKARGRGLLWAGALISASCCMRRATNRSR